MKKTKRILGAAGLILTILSLASCNFEEVFNDKPEADMSNIYFEDRYFQYDGEEKTMNIIGELPEGVRVAYTNNVQKDKGTYEVTATFTSSDYKKIEPMTATMSIIDLNVGSYPQSVVKDKTLHDNIIKYGTFNKTTGLMTYNGKEYEILECHNLSAEESKPDFKLSDNSIMKYKNIYVFEIEPIKWRILDKTKDGHYILLAEDILDSCSYFYNNFEEYKCGYTYTTDKYDIFYSYATQQEFNSETGEFTETGRNYYLKDHELENYENEQNKEKCKSMIGKKSRYGIELTNAEGSTTETVTNNYEYSYVREWLNNEFYNVAFNSDDKTKVLKTKVDNSRKSAFNSYTETYYDENGEQYYLNKYFKKEKLYNIDDWNEDIWKGRWNGWLSNDTEDYVYLPSANDLSNVLYGFEGVKKIKDVSSTEKIEATTVEYSSISRKCNISDYAACRGAKKYTMIGWEWDYMTRTPLFNDGFNNYKEGIYYVGGHNGRLLQANYNSYVRGIRPMITVKLDD